MVLDTFGLMHDPDQRAAFELRAKTTAADGVLLVQIPSLMAMVSQGQWNLLRHSHFGYHSLTALTNLLGAVGMSIATVWEFDLLGGTYLAAAVHGQVQRDERADEILKAERHFGVTKPYVLRRMQQAVDVHVAQLRQWLETQAAQQHSVYAYCAGSRVPGLFSVAGIDRRLIRASPTPRPTSMGAGSRAPTSRSSPRAARRCRSRSGLVDVAVPLRRSPADVPAAGRPLVGGPWHFGHARSGVKSPRILWLSPWLRPLARVQVEALRRHDADVLLVTSDQHRNPMPPATTNLCWIRDFAPRRRGAPVSRRGAAFASTVRTWW